MVVALDCADVDFCAMETADDGQHQHPWRTAAHFAKWTIPALHHCPQIYRAQLLGNRKFAYPWLWARYGPIAARRVGQPTYLSRTATGEPKICLPLAVGRATDPSLRDV